MDTLELVHRSDTGTPLTNSHIIAEGTSSQHSSVIRLIRENLTDLEDFGRVGFEIQPFDTAGGKQERTIAVLNREHAMLLMTYMRNNEVVKDFKKRLIKAFVELEKAATAPALPQDYVSALRELAASVEQAEIEKRRADEQEQLARRASQALQIQAPAVAKAQAHSGVTEWKGKQDFAREVQQWGDLQGFDLKQRDIIALLTRKGMYIAGGRSDSGQVKRDAVRAGWGKNEKGVVEKTGRAYVRPLISPRGQDVAWKWIVKAIEEYGETLKPEKKAA